MSLLVYYKFCFFFFIYFSPTSSFLFRRIKLNKFVYLLIFVFADFKNKIFNKSYVIKKKLINSSIAEISNDF
jgi:hypothetical protein